MVALDHTCNGKAEGTQMAQTVFNFNPGPAILPPPVLEEAQSELRDYHSTGMSLLEMSHRSAEYEAINAEAQARLKDLLGLGDDYQVLFLQGGASLQFAMVPMNFLRPDTVADYIMTGAWSEKALAEAGLLGEVRIAASTGAGGYRRVPRRDELALSDRPAYVHVTSNETIHGVQWHDWPDFGDRPLIADVSSDILAGPLDARRFALIYAGAQKNLGPAGATIVIARADFLERAPQTIPAILRYATHAKANSLYNTPPAFAVYLIMLTLRWIEEEGGLEAMAERNRRKAETLYNAIDSSGGFYRGHAEPGSRSLMNVTFRLPSDADEKAFLSAAIAAGFVGLAGHRSVGGIRASIYNAMTIEGCTALAGFMGEFARGR
jgi:phosphoserine aminotransferase